MNVQIVGIKPTRFKPQNSDSEIVGQNIFFEYEQENVIGVCTDSCFLSQKKEIEVIPHLPAEAKIFYNKFGKVEELVLVKK